MKFSFALPTALEYFASLVHSDGEFRLFEAAVSLAQDEYPSLDVQSVLHETDQLLDRLKRRLPADAGHLQKLRALNQFFYEELHFVGNVNDYYDPENSFIHALLRTRRGIPVSMAVLWMELAQSMGLSVRGVAFPGHFLVRVNLPMGQAVLDPLTGRSLAPEDLSELLEPHRQAHPEFAAMDASNGVYLKTAPERQIIARMLYNLREIYQAEQDWQRLLAVHERLVVLLPNEWAVRRDRGLVHAQLGNNRQAVIDLECYLAHTDALNDVNDIASRVQTLRQQTD